jgi:hypothetical protein
VASSATTAAEIAESVLNVENIDLKDQATLATINQDQSSNLKSIGLFIQFFKNLEPAFKYLGSIDNSTVIESIKIFSNDSITLVDDADETYLSDDTSLRGSIETASAVSPTEISQIDAFVEDKGTW